MIRKYDLIILVIGFRDYKKAYDKVSCSWLKETLKTVGVADNIPRLLRQSIYNWKTKFASNDDTLSEVSTERRIFQGCCLRYYSLLFSYLWLWITLIMDIYLRKKPDWSFFIQGWHVLWYDMKLYEKEGMYLITDRVG